MRPDCYWPREFIVEFPDDYGRSLEAVVDIADGNGLTVWLGEWLLHFSDPVVGVHFRFAFPDFKVTRDHRFIVPDEDRKTAEAWIAECARREANWTHLEMITPWSLATLRNWAVVYRQVVGKRPRLRSFALWPDRFGPNAL